MCWMCDASNDHPDWRDMGPNACWRRTLRSHNDYLDLTRHQLPAIFLIAGFRLECIVIDAMHTVDLGCAQHIIGNVFYELSNSKQLGKNHDESVNALWTRLQQWYREPPNRTSSRIPSLKYEDFKRSGEAPKFHGKAANTRHLVQFVLDLCKEFNTGTQVDSFRRDCVQGLLDFYVLLEKPGWAMSSESYGPWEEGQHVDNRGLVKGPI